MTKLHLSIAFSFLLISCNWQTRGNSDAEGNNSAPIDLRNEVSNGIVYFSFDNGNSWVNASDGLPENASIGIGGIAVSNQSLGVAIKEKGVYVYNFIEKLWENVPTEKQILEGNIGALVLMDSTIYLGKQS
jgi:hypothetical protein